MESSDGQKVLVIYEERKKKLLALEEKVETINSKIQEIDTGLTALSFQSGSSISEYATYRKSLTKKLQALLKKAEEVRVEFLQAEKRLNALK